MYLNENEMSVSKYDKRFEGLKGKMKYMRTLLPEAGISGRDK